MSRARHIVNRIIQVIILLAIGGTLGYLTREDPPGRKVKFRTGPGPGCIILSLNGEEAQVMHVPLDPVGYEFNYTGVTDFRMIVYGTHNGWPRDILTEVREEFLPDSIEHPFQVAGSCSNAVRLLCDYPLYRSSAEWVHYKCDTPPSLPPGQRAK